MVVTDIAVRYLVRSSVVSFVSKSNEYTNIILYRDLSSYSVRFFWKWIRSSLEEKLKRIILAIS